MNEHPKLTSALEALDNGDAAPIFAVGIGARLAADEGNYCECAEPLLTGLDLMCGACLLNNRMQERRRVVQIVGPHVFVPGLLGGVLCEICTMQASAPRHNGVGEVGRCSWGEELHPPYQTQLEAVSVCQVCLQPSSRSVCDGCESTGGLFGDWRSDCGWT